MKGHEDLLTGVTICTFARGGSLVFDSSGAHDDAPAVRTVHDFWKEFEPRFWESGALVSFAEWAPSRALEGEIVCGQNITVSGARATPLVLTAIPVRDDEGSVIAAVVVQSSVTGRNPAHTPNSLPSATGPNLVHTLNNLLNPLVQLAWLLERNADDPNAVRRLAGELTAALASATEAVASLRNTSGGGEPSEVRDETGGTSPTSSRFNTAAVDNVRRPATGRINPDPKKGPEDGSSRGVRRVLVVEDQEEGRRLIERILRGEGYSVDSVGSFTEACRALRAAGDYTLMLTDLGLPDGDGGDLVAVARKAQPGIRVGVISGISPDELGGIDADADFILNKPLRASDLIGSLGAAGNS